MLESEVNKITGITSSKSRSILATLIKRLFKEKPLGAVGAILTLLFLLTGIFAGFLAPYGMNEIHMQESLAPPSAKYLLGTDNLGRDVLSRIIYGARTSMIVGLAGTSIAIVVATIIGISTGYLGGNFDLVVQRVVDSWMCFPLLIILIVFASILGHGMWQVIVIVGAVYGINGSRIVRGAVIAIKDNAYIEVAVAIGSSTWRTMIRHVLTNVMPSIIILFTIWVPAVIMLEAAMSFLGLGIPPPQPSWGGMLSGSARAYMFKAPGMAFWPGLVLSAVVYGVNIFGDALRDLMDPRLRGGTGRYGVRRGKKKTAGH